MQLLCLIKNSPVQQHPFIFIPQKTSKEPPNSSTQAINISHTHQKKEDWDAKHGMLVFATQAGFKRDEGAVRSQQEDQHRDTEGQAPVQKHTSTPAAR